MWHLKCFDVTALNNPLWHKSPPCGEASLPDGVVFRFQIAPTSLGCDLVLGAGIGISASKVLRFLLKGVCLYFLLFE